MPMSSVGAGRAAHGVGEGRRQPHAEVPLHLRHDGEAVEVEVARCAVQRHDPAGDGSRAHRVEGVPHRGRGDAGGLLGGAGRGEPGLAPAGDRRLGDDDDLGAQRRGHRASTPRMSRTVRTVPSTVPVTLDFVPSVRRL